MLEIKKLLSEQFGNIYHPVLHRFRHREEYRALRPVLRKSLKVMKRFEVSLRKSSVGTVVKGKSLIQIHVFYTDLLLEFYSHLKGITVPYDLYVSTDTEEKKLEIESFFRDNTLCAGKIVVGVFENRGRDVYPFLAQVHDVKDEYEYVAHFHSKKTLHSTLGDYWRQSLLESLLGDGRRYDNAVAYFEKNPDCGLLFPEIPKAIRWRYAKAKLDEWNDGAAKDCLSMLGITSENFCLLDYEFPIGTMFIARIEAVRQVFEHTFKAADFPAEEGQVEHTLQHALELVWQPVCEFNGYRLGIV